MRHAKTENSHTALHDKDRNLTETGIREAMQMGKNLKQKSWIPQFIFCSTANRTIQTCKILNESLQIPEERIQYMDQLYLAHSEELYKIMLQTNDCYHNIMIIGHNPSVTHFPYLTCENLIDHVPTGGLLKMSFEVAQWNEITKGSGKLEAIEFPTKILF